MLKFRQHVAFCTGIDPGRLYPVAIRSRPGHPCAYSDLDDHQLLALAAELQRQWREADCSVAAGAIQHSLHRQCFSVRVSRYEDEVFNVSGTNADPLPDSWEISLDSRTDFSQGLREFAPYSWAA